MGIDKSLFLSGICDKYDEKLLKGRVTVEGNVVSNIFLDPLLIDDSTLEPRDFITKDGKFLFSLAKDLRSKKISVFDEVSILSNSKDEVIDRFNDIGGYEMIEHMKSIVSTKNWDSYITTLHKENTILKLAADGFNLLKPIDINGKQVEPLTLFRKMEDSETITDFYESRMASYSSGYSSKVLEEEEIDFDDEFINSCEEGLENGVPFTTAGKDIDGEDILCFPYLSNHIMGFLPGTFSIVGGYSSTGKSTMYVTIIMGLLEDKNNKCLIISNEQKASAFKKNFIVWILCKKFKYFKLTKKKLMSGNITDEDRDMWKKAQSYWREKYHGRIKYISIPDANTSLVKKKIRENVLRHGYNICLYDTMKIDMSSSTDKKEYLSLIQDSRDFDAIAKKYNIIMMASLQLAIHTLGKLFLDASVLSQSKQIKECVENLILIRTVYAEELDSKSRYYFKPYRLKKSQTGVWVREDYELDPNAVYRAIFIDKCRSGSSSSDNGQALCYKYKGEFATFSESCWIQPAHSQIV